MIRNVLLTGALGAALAPAMAGAATMSTFLVSDQTRDEIQLATDLNGDGDANDPGEVSVFFSAASRAGLGAVTGNVFSIHQTRSGAVLFGDGDTDSVYLLRDRNGDGSAQGKNEARLWFSAAGNASGYTLKTPNGIAQGPDGAVYIVEADTSPATGDWVYRTQDLNGDGDANDAGEATRWLDLKALNASSSPFEIRFDGDTAYIIDSAGATPNVIYRARDADGSGAIEAGEVNVFAQADAIGAVFDFAMDVYKDSLLTWQWLSTGGVSSVFRLTDADGNGSIDASETFEVWNTTLLDPLYTFLAGFSMSVNQDTGEVFILSNAGSANGRWIARLFDLDGDGAFWGAGESEVVLSNLYQPDAIQRPRAVETYATPAPVPLPAGLPLLAGAVGLMALLRRRAAKAL